MRVASGPEGDPGRPDSGRVAADPPAPLPAPPELADYRARVEAHREAHRPRPARELDEQGRSVERWPAPAPEPAPTEAERAATRAHAATVFDRHGAPPAGGAA